MLSLVPLVAAMAVAQTAPIISLPAPTGVHRVGTFTAQWTDPNRLDSLTNPRGPRRGSMQFWYPARSRSGDVPAPYAPGIDSMAGEYGQLMAHVRGTATLNAPFDSGVGRSPVVVLSTGRSMAAYDYTSIAEELASQGFIVVGVNSPQLSRIVLPEGGVIPPWPAPPLSVLQRFDSADVFFEPMIRLVAADLRFVVARLGAIDHLDPILKGHLDLDRLGMMGHSNGAIAGSRACAEEVSCRAFFGIEGTQSREIRKQGIGKPYALLISEQSLGFDSENVYRELGSRKRAPYTVIVVKGAGHNSASDLLLVRPTLFNYPIQPTRGVEIARVAVRGFFEQLRGRGAETGMQSLLAPYPEVTVETSFVDRPRAP